MSRQSVMSVLAVSVVAFAFPACGGEEKAAPEEVLTIEDVIGDVDLRCSPTKEEEEHCATAYQSKFAREECEGLVCDERKVREACEEASSSKADACVEEKLPLVKLLRVCYIANGGYDVSNLIRLPKEEHAQEINDCINAGFDRAN